MSSTVVTYVERARERAQLTRLKSTSLGGETKFRQYTRIICKAAFISPLSLSAADEPVSQKWRGRRARALLDAVPQLSHLNSVKFPLEMSLDCARNRQKASTTEKKEK